MEKDQGNPQHKMGMRSEGGMSSRSGRSTPGPSIGMRPRNFLSNDGHGSGGRFSTTRPTRLVADMEVGGGVFQLGFGERGQILLDLTGLLRQPLKISENVVVHGLKYR